jgi:hypothetical protein
MWVVPCGLVETSLALIVPGPSLRNVMILGCPAVSLAASSFSPRNVIVALVDGGADAGAVLGATDEADVGLGAGTEAVGVGERLGAGLPDTADDPGGVGEALVEAVGEPPRPTMMSNVIATTTTSSPTRAPTSVRRLRSVI